MAARVAALLDGPRQRPAGDGGRPRLKIGVVGSLSGARSAHRHMFYAAHARLRAAGIDCVLEDDAATPALAVQAAQRMIALRVCAVIGHFSSACAQAVIPLYRAHGIVLLLPAASQSDLAVGGTVFRLCGTDLHQAALLAQGALALADGGGIDVATDGTPYARRLVEALRALHFAAAAMPVDSLAPPGPDVAVRVVLAVTPAAEAAHAALCTDGWPGYTLFGDDAHAPRFLSRIATPGAKVFVAGPAAGFAALLVQACDLALAWRDTAAAAGTMADWLAQLGRFDAAGEARAAAWRLHPASPEAAQALSGNGHGGRAARHHAYAAIQTTN